MMKAERKSPLDIYRERASQPDFCHLNEIADSFIVFVILLEDCTFFKHKRGYDLKLIWLAFKNHVRYGSRYGGSTITQQLVKNLYFTFERRISRKIRELFYASCFEKHLTKLQILELYINTIYYDNGQYGIYNASHFYFHCEPDDLTGNQAFFLASLLPVVGVCNPLYHPEPFVRHRDRKLRNISYADQILPEELVREITRHGSDCLDEALRGPGPETDRYNAPGPLINERFGPGCPECLTSWKEGKPEKRTTSRKSPLVGYTRLSPNHSGPRTHRIDRITPHCTAGLCTAEGLGELFSHPSGKVSANYGVDRDGRIGLYVAEENCSWCSSSPENDQRAVTIECASEAEEPYAMSETVYRGLVGLCADICRRNGKKKMLWIADRDQALAYTPADDEMVLTVHRWFANKNCPGAWLFSRLDQLARNVTDALS